MEGRSEVQTLTTSLNHRPQIQRLFVGRASSVSAVHRINASSEWSLHYGPYSVLDVPTNATAFDVHLAFSRALPFAIEDVRKLDSVYDVTFADVAGDVPLPTTDGAVVTRKVRGIAPESFRLDLVQKLETLEDEGFAIQIDGTLSTAMLPLDATAYEIEEALNRVLDHSRYGTVVVTNENPYFSLVFRNSCVAPSLGVSSSPRARITETTPSRAPLSGDITLSLDGVATNSIDVFASDAASTIETELEAVIASLSDIADVTIDELTVEEYENPCGRIFDITLPRRRDWSSLEVEANDDFSIETLVRGSQYEVQSVTLVSPSGTWFLAFDGMETRDLSASALATTVETALVEDIDINVAVSREVAGSTYTYSVTFLDAFPDGGPGEMLQIGGYFEKYGDGTSETLSATSANATIARRGRWSPVGGFLTLSLDGQNVTVPATATARELEAIFEAEPVVFGTTTVERNVLKEDQQTYAWTITFLERAGDVPELVVNSSLRSDGITNATVITVVDGNATDVDPDASIVLNTTTDLVTLPVTATAAEVAAALDLDVRVQSRVSGGATWLLTRDVWSDEPLIVGGWPDGTFLSVTVGVAQHGARPSVVRVSLIAGAPMEGTFQLVAAGRTTEHLSVFATADDVRTAMEARGLVVEVQVTLDTRTNFEGRAWDLTFVSGGSAVQCLVANATGIGIPTPTCTVEVLQAEEVTLDTRSFRLAFDGAVTEPITANATKAEVHAALHSLETIGDITVSEAPVIEETGATSILARIWRVTFLSDALGTTVRHLGDQPSLQVLALTSEENRTEATVSVRELVRGSHRDGTWRFKLGDTTSLRIPYDATAETVEVCLREAFTEFDVPNDVMVSKQADSYLVTFPASYGDAPLLEAESELTAVDAAVRITEITKGASPTSPRGAFSLSFRGSWTWDLEVTTLTASALEAALESLPTVGDLDVVQWGDAVYDITFTTLGIPPNDGDLPLIMAMPSSRNDLDSIISLSVDEILKGCCAVALSFNGGFDWIQADNVHFTRDAETMVTGVDPPFGPASGGTSIVVLVGPRLSTKRNLKCVFGGTFQTPATRLNDTAASCTTPQHPPANAVTVELVAEDTVVASAGFGAAVFSFDKDAVLMTASPRFLDAWSGTVVTVKGQNLPYSYQRGGDIGRTVCLFTVVDAPPVVETASTRTVERRLPASVLDEETLTCSLPSLPEIGLGDLVSPTRAKLSILTNGVDTASGTIDLAYAATPTALAVDPVAGPRKGGTTLTIQTNWTNLEWDVAMQLQLQDSFTCAIGSNNVDGRLLAYDKVQCLTPVSVSRPAVHVIRASTPPVIPAVQVIQLDVAADDQDSGFFQACLDGYCTRNGSLALNATADDVRRALEELVSCGAVEVTKTESLEAVNGRERFVTNWTVTFTSRQGPVPLFDVSDNVVAFPETEGSPAMGEVQEINVAPIFAVSRREVQKIRLKSDVASPQYEQQRIRLEESAVVSNSATFRLSYGTNTTNDLAWDADAATVRSELELLAEVGLLEVARTTAGTRGFAWVVTFLGALEDRPLLIFSSSDVNGAVERLAQYGPSITGNFSLLSSEGVIIGPLASLATDRDMEAAFAEAGIPDVDATVTSTSRSRAWDVSFPDAMGDVSLLRVVNSSSLNFNATVTELTRGVPTIAGELTLEVGLNVTGRLDLSIATGAQVQRALEHTLGVMPIVSRDGPPWRVTFPAILGDVAEMRPLFAGTAIVNVTTVRNGTWAPLGGTFRLGNSTLAFNATAAEVRSALNNDEWPLVSRVTRTLDEYQTTWTLDYVKAGPRELPRPSSNLTGGHLEVYETTAGVGPEVGISLSANGWNFANDRNVQCRNQV